MKLTTATILLTALAVGWAAPTLRAAVIAEVEPNNSVGTAQNIDAVFTLDFDSDIGDQSTNTSTQYPHVTINGTGDGTFDYYSFTVANAGDIGIFDIDYTVAVDSYLRLYTGGGSFLTSNDDSSTLWGQGGSSSFLDSYLQYTFTSPGTYAIEVGSCCVGTVPAASSYQLQVSVGTPPPPPPPPPPPGPGLHVITFEELSGDSNPIPDGYFGFDWNNMYFINGGVEQPGSGYDNGTSSGEMAAFNAFANPADVLTISGDPFTFAGAYFTAAWNNGLSITVEGYRDGSLEYTTTFQVNTTGPTFIPLDYVNVDELRFLSFGGVNAGLGNSGEHFVMDDFTFYIVPEPSALTLLGLGVAVVLGLGPRKRKGARNRFRGSC